MGTGGAADITAITGPALTLDATTARLGTVQITNDARLRVRNFDPVTSFRAGALTLEAANGALSLGGTTEPGLTDAEFQRITVSGAFNLYAGQTAASVNVPVPVYGDLTVGDLSVDPARIPALNLLARIDRSVNVRGQVRTTGSGGALRIGEAAAESVWSPRSINITGALGTARGDVIAGFTDVRGFRAMELYAARDILLGSQRFIDLVAQTPVTQIDVDRGLPAGVAAQGDEVGKLYLVSGSLRAAAGERIVQQNTGPAADQEAGIFLTGQGIGPSDALLTLGRAQVADLFGAFATDQGVVFGKQAPLSARIARADGAASSSLRFNGCPLGLGCSLAINTHFRVDQFEPVAPEVVVDPPVLVPPPSVDEEEEDAEGVVTGTGNEEIWRRSK